MDRKIVTTKDGSHSFYLPDMNEHYHSSWGAITESKHVFIKAGLKETQNQHIQMLEIGFGTGLNALLTLNEAIQNNQLVTYHAIEKYPLHKEEYQLLNYTDLINPDLKSYFRQMHRSPWNNNTEIHKNFVLKKEVADFREMNLSSNYDLVYFDAFAPDKQPELWSFEIFEKIIGCMQTGGIVVTYTAKGTVRRCWESLGLVVEKLPGPPGKREFLRGRKK
jgi:tRNA U34 5-methylaminomethyl-2-thiouridine-forming methyltransferase MnmC